MTDDLVKRLRKLLAGAEQQRREALNHLPGDTKTMMLTNAAHAERHVLAQVPLLFARIEALEAENRKLREGHKVMRDGYADAASGLRYVLQEHGRLFGVGFDRVEDHFFEWVTMREREGLLAGSSTLTPEAPHAD